MRILTDVIISFFELIEAEGRELRRIALLLSVMFAFFLVGSVMAAAGFVLICAAVYHLLLPRVGQASAYSTTGVFALLTAFLTFAGCFFFVKTNFPTGGHSNDERCQREKSDAAGGKGESGGSSGPGDADSAD